MSAKTIFLGGSALLATILAAPATAQEQPQGESTNQTIEQRLKTLEDREAARETAERAEVERLSKLEQAATSTPKDKKIYFNGLTLTLGGYLAMETVWRSSNLESDIGSPGFAKIPFAGPGGGGNGNNVAIAHTSELRFSARQSRLQGLMQGDVDPNTHLAMWEFDFLGGAASANSNESNSYQPRIRNLYGSIDWSDIGVHFLFGQSWSLATLDAQGMSERTELAPPTIEAQYSAGFVWTRQPQLRITKNFGNQFWVGLSLENPQTTIGGTAPSGYTGLTVNSGSGFNGSSTKHHEELRQPVLGWALARKPADDHRRDCALRLHGTDRQ